MNSIGDHRAAKALEPNTPIFASLEYPGTRRYFAGLIGSMIGTWTQSVAMSWLIVNELGGGGRELGYLMISQFLPTLLFGAWAGALSDRLDKRKLMFVTQIALGSAALVLGLIDLADRETLPLVLAIAGVSGFATAFDTPIRRALIGDLVPRDVLPNAMSLNTAVLTSSRVVGAAIGGFLSQWFGTGWCFLLNAASYLLMLLALIGLAERAHRSDAARENAGVMDAVRHVLRTPVLLAAMAVTSIIATFAFNYNVTLSLMTKRVFGHEAGSFGVLLAAAGVGSFLGALISARAPRPHLPRFLAGSFIMSVSLIALAKAPTFATAMVVCVPLGLGGGLLMAQLSGLLTSFAPSQMRGRMLALQSVVFLGSTPIGSPLIGWVADRSGPRWGLAFGGTAGLTAATIALAWMLTRNGRAALSLARSDIYREQSL